MVSTKFLFLNTYASELYQRTVHQECKGNEKYWNFIDQRLAVVRRLAGSDASKVVKWVSSLGSSTIIYLYPTYTGHSGLSSRLIEKLTVSVRIM